MPGVLRQVRSLGLHFVEFIHQSAKDQGRTHGLPWLNTGNNPSYRFGMATLHLHWSGEGDYLLPHTDVKQKDTTVSVSCLFGATLFMWEHDGSMKGRHAAEEDGIFSLVDTGSELDDQLRAANFGARHVHRRLNAKDKGGNRLPFKSTSWSSVYLQAGDMLILSSGHLMQHSAMKSSLQPCTCIMLQYQRVLPPSL